MREAMSSLSDLSIGPVAWKQRLSYFGFNKPPELGVIWPIFLCFIERMSNASQPNHIFKFIKKNPHYLRLLALSRRTFSAIISLSTFSKLTNTKRIRD